MRVVEGTPVGDDSIAVTLHEALPHGIPLSYAQQRLWFLDQLAPGNPFYVETSALRIPTKIRPKALQMSIDAVVARHDVLRTSFEPADGRPIQHVAPELHVPLDVIDVSQHPSRNDELTRIIGERSQRPFDLTTCPLLRTTLVRLDDDDHVLILSLHHIITDGWSMQVFGREVSTLYRCLVTGTAVDLPELPIQYADYSRWQRSDEHGAVIDQQLDYWREQLANLPALELPTDHPRPPVGTYRGSDTSIRIPAGLTDRIGSLARTEGCTTFMIAFAAWAVVLSRHSDQHDIAIGVPLAGRDRPEFEHLIGCFLNNLVVRVDLSDDPPFRKIVERTRAALVGGFAHQDVPFDRLVQELHPARDLARHPLFQVMFQFFNTDGVAADDVKVRRTTAIVDLFLHLWDDSGGIQGKIEYSSDLFEASTINDLARHYVVLLTAAIDHPDTPVSNLALVTRADRSQLREFSSGPTVDVDGPMTIPDLWQRQLERTPEATALIDGPRTWSYRELAERVAAIGDLLLQAELSERSVVGLCLERSVDAVAAMLAVNELGHAWVPLDPGYPQAVLNHVVADSGAAVVLTHAGLASRITTDCVIDLAAAEASGEQRNPDTRPGPRDVACLIYTSGSTGQPKGVMAEHAGIYNRLAWMWREFPFEQGEVLALKTALSFVDCIWETLGPLLGGVPAVILSNDIVRDPQQLVPALRSHRVTRLLAVPSLLRAMLDTGLEIGLELPMLRRWFTSGEPLSDSLVERFASFVPDARLANLYGSSEVAGDVTCGHVEPGRCDIGRPIANTTVHVLDEHLTPVPIGVPGRIYVGGANLARGYHNQPAPTAAAFVPDPFSDLPGARLYDTGDRGRWSRDGRIEFLGRRDHQVKIRGYRVELGHVERSLCDHPDVVDAVVALVRLNEYNERLTAFVQSAATIDELRSHARQVLPGYMVPGQFIVVDEMPRKPNGKLDRSALSSVNTPAVSEPRYIAPSTDAQRQLAEMWKELLGVERVSTHDNFFEVGGHSLLATRLVSLVRDRLDAELPLATIFERPVLRDMADEIERVASGVGSAGPPLSSTAQAPA